MSCVYSRTEHHIQILHCCSTQPACQNVCPLRGWFMSSALIRLFTPRPYANYFLVCADDAWAHHCAGASDTSGHLCPTAFREREPTSGAWRIPAHSRASWPGQTYSRRSNNAVSEIHGAKPKLRVTRAPCIIHAPRRGLIHSTIAPTSPRVTLARVLSAPLPAADKSCEIARAGNFRCSFAIRFHKRTVPPISVASLGLATSKVFYSEEPIPLSPPLSKLHQQ